MSKLPIEAAHHKQAPHEFQHGWDIAVIIILRNCIMKVKFSNPQTPAEKRHPPSKSASQTRAADRFRLGPSFKVIWMLTLEIDFSGLRGGALSALAGAQVY